jgi:hypothetical protein
MFHVNDSEPGTPEGFEGLSAAQIKETPRGSGCGHRSREAYSVLPILVQGQGNPECQTGKGNYLYWYPRNMVLDGSSFDLANVS